jgi:hypothetical protein
LAKKDWVEIEKGTYTLKKKVPSHPIVTIPSHEDESTQSQAQRTK